MRKKMIVIFIVILAVIFFLIYKGFIVFDHSAELNGYGVLWNNVQYIPCTGGYHEGKTIAKTTSGWNIDEVEEDPSHTFIVAREFLDQMLYVRENYEIPSSGDITMAFLGDVTTIYDKEFCQALSEIMKTAESDFEYETEAIFMRTDRQKMQSLYVAYNDCPVATSDAGYIGLIDDKWYITTEISQDRRNSDGSAKVHKVWCYTIPEKYTDILKAYIQ